MSDDGPDSSRQRYTRPAGKSGGHGIGWTQFAPYTFVLPRECGFEEVPVSIADLGGTELDLRFESPSHGSIAVVVAPQARFTESLSSDIQKLGTIDTMIDGFAPEIIGQPLNEGAVEEQTEVMQASGKRVFQYLLDQQVGKSRRTLVSMLANGNRLYIFSLKATPLQWRKNEESLRAIQKSFDIIL